MLTVAAVYKPGAGFTDEYVYRLRIGVLKHLTLPHEFVCYTDQPLRHVRTLPLVPGLNGWFNKASLWLGERVSADPVLYFDLDTMIVGNIDRLASCPRATLLGDLLQALRGRRSLQTGMMFLTQDALDKLKKNHNPATFSVGGDATYVRSMLSDAPTFQEWAPGQICSWRAQWMVGERNPDTRVICFHGSPRPSDVGWDLNARWSAKAYTIRAPGVVKGGAL